MQVNPPGAQGSSRLGSNGAVQASMPPSLEDRRRSGRAQDSREQEAGSLRFILKRQRDIAGVRAAMRLRISPVLPEDLEL